MSVVQPEGKYRSELLPDALRQEAGQLADMSPANRRSGRRWRSAWGPARLCARRCRAPPMPTTTREADQPDPVAILDKQNVEEGPEAGFGALSAHAGLALHLPARLCGGHGKRPVAHRRSAASPLETCGDMHVSNFGVYASAERNLVFAINDFDEIHPGPWEWDLKRLAASAAVAARFMGGDEAARLRKLSRRLRGRAIAGACAAMPRWAISRSGTTTIDDARCSTALSPRVPRNLAEQHHRQGARQGPHPFARQAH